MQFNAQHLGLLALAFFGTANAYVVTLFDGPDCSGDSYDWNVSFDPPTPLASC